MDGAFWKGSRQGWGPATLFWPLPALPEGGTARLLPLSLGIGFVLGVSEAKPAALGYRCGFGVLVPVWRGGFGVPGWSACVGKCSPSRKGNRSSSPCCRLEASPLRLPLQPLHGSFPKEVNKTRRAGGQFIEILAGAGSWQSLVGGSGDVGGDGAGGGMGAAGRALPGQRHRGESIPAPLPPPDVRELGSAAFLSGGRKKKEKINKHKKSDSPSRRSPRDPSGNGSFILL